MSSILAACEQFRASAQFDRAPWLAVAFAAGIGAWFALPGPWQWAGLIALCLSAALAALAGLREDGEVPYLRQALVLLPLAVAAGSGTVWTKSAMVGQPATSATGAC